MQQYNNEFIGAGTYISTSVLHGVFYSQYISYQNIAYRCTSHLHK